MGIHPDQVLSLIFWMFVPGIIVARAFYVIEYWPQFQKETLEQTIWAVAAVAKGGLVVYGSLLCGLCGLIAFARKNRISLLVLGDLMVPSVALGMALGRVGCLLNGCCFGGTGDLPWAITFPWNSPAHVQQVQAGQADVYGLKFAGVRRPRPNRESSPAARRPKRACARANDRGDQLPDRPRRGRCPAVAVVFPRSGPHRVGRSPRSTHPKQWTVTVPLPRSLPVIPASFTTRSTGWCCACCCWLTTRSVAATASCWD